MALDDVYGFMQGFMSGQSHVSDMKTAEAERQAKYADTAAKLFAMEEDVYARPYERQARVARANQSVLDYNFNKKTDRWKTASYINEVDTMLKLKPGFLARAGVQTERDITALNADKFNIAIQNARTVGEQNSVLAKFGMNYRVQADDKGNMWTTDLSGKALESPMPAALFNQSLFNPAKMAAAGTEYELAVGLDQATRQQQGGYYAPDMSMAPVQPVALQGEQPALNNKLTGGAAPAQPAAPAPAQPGVPQAQQRAAPSLPSRRDLDVLVGNVPPPPVQRVDTYNPMAAAVRQNAAGNFNRYAPIVRY